MGLIIVVVLGLLFISLTPTTVAAEEHEDEALIEIQKKYETDIKLLEAALEETTRQKGALATELADVRTLLESAERARKNAENELHDTTTRLTHASRQVTQLAYYKRRLEADILSMRSDLDNALGGMTAAEKRADRLVAQVNRLVGEAIQEHENYKNSEVLRKQLEVEINEIKLRLAEAKAVPISECNRQIAELQARIRDLEVEAEQLPTG